MLANYTRSAQALSDLLQREGVEDKEVLKAI
ncbi:MAG TPA: protein-L-isoaspartate(D-aspartate) O-methyltransferase, partial [Pseudoalteromonas sp.]|nr:protein-L-isoaspartate(D-aspartate) O-methyltransferase [Pseudoalteromonas sp.]